MDAGLDFMQESIADAMLYSENRDFLRFLVNMERRYEREMELLKKRNDQMREVVDSIKRDTEQINTKMDSVLEKLDGLEVSFNELKTGNRDVEEKLAIMSSKLDRLEKTIPEEELEDYTLSCQKNYDKWNDMEELSKHFIQVAEYLFTKMQAYEKLDYSPVIIELCRALENEFLQKIFIKYTAELLKREGNRLNIFFSHDRASTFINGRTGLFIKIIEKSKNNNETPTYTLGEMKKIISFMNNPKLVKESPLLQDFNKFLVKNTDQIKLLKKEYLEQIQQLVDNYRNPSAHPNYMNLQSACDCKKEIPKQVNYFMDCVCVK